MGASSWPALALDEWRDTYATLHMWLQIVGKVRTALSPPVNHFWSSTFLVTARGLATPPLSAGDRTLDMSFDFIDHNLYLRAADGSAKVIGLFPRSVAEFYHELMGALGALGIAVTINPMPQEVPDSVPCDVDDVHDSYDPECAHRFWRVLLQADRVLNVFRSRFLGKCSPVHFFWGSCDLAVTRFSGRRAPRRTGADRVTREAYSHEVSSCGFWPGSGPVQHAAFYSYAAPEPQGFRTAAVAPASARYESPPGEFILGYDDVRLSKDPDWVLLSFLQSTYDAAADLGGWDRAALERGETKPAPRPR